MTLHEISAISDRWVNDTGVAAKDVRLLCDEVRRLHAQSTKDSLLISKLLYDAELLKTIIEAGVTHEQEE
jgi:hypothetical protein